MYDYLQNHTYQQIWHTTEKFDTIYVQLGIISYLSTSVNVPWVKEVIRTCDCKKTLLSPECSFQFSCDCPNCSYGQHCQILKWLQPLSFVSAYEETTRVLSLLACHCVRSFICWASFKFELVRIKTNLLTKTTLSRVCYTGKIYYLIK